MKQMFNTFEELSDFIDQHYSIKTKTYQNIKSLLPKLKTFKQLIASGFNEDDIAFAVKRRIMLEHHYCPQCGNEIHVYDLNRYPKCCSISCGVKYSQELRIKNSLERYGTRNPKQTQANKDKYKKTMLERYGGYTFQSKLLLDKVTKTNIERYGVEVAGSNKELHKKNVETCLERYGVTHTSKLKENREKAGETNLRLHGSKTYNNQKQTEKTCLERYGVRNPMQCHDVRVKQQQRYVYNGISFDSSWEIAYYIWLVDHNVEFIYQPNCGLTYRYKRKIHVYCPDFKVGNILVEIKGSQYFNKTKTKMICPYNRAKDGLFNAKYKCMIRNNVRIIDEIKVKQYLDYIENKYGKMYLSSFRRKTVNVKDMPCK